MTYDYLTALCIFALVTSITPGPNNLMLMASGANYGYARSVPHMAGIVAGFAVLLVVVGFGLFEVFETVPATYLVLKVLGVVYLLYLAWKIASAAPPDTVNEDAGAPMTFFQAALFQWVNPKAWTVGLAAVTIYAPSRSLSAILLLTLVFAAVTVPSISVWTLMGQRTRNWLTSTLRLRVFNGAMAVLLVASLYPMVIAP
ncbi:MAG: LysE family translocator [Pseudomonadota bacterium]